MLSRPEITKMFRKATQVWNESKDYLSEIDSRFGGGGHNITIGKAAGLIEKSLDGWGDDNVETFPEDPGDDIMEIGGGSIGPLYGAMIGRLSGPLEENKFIDIDTLKEMFTECLSAMESITSAGVGGKTMMDALIPAVGAAQGTEDDVTAVLEAAKGVAARSVKEGEQYVPKYGRARSYRERTAGTSDTGTMSTSLFFTGLCDELKQAVTEVEGNGNGR